MKLGDVERLVGDGLISAEQRAAIVERYHLQADPNRGLKVFSLMGGIMIALGLILLAAANWDEIPKFAKVGMGLGLMAGAHWGGWWFRERRSGHARTAEALHLVGSLLFLGNLALVGQIYHVSARPSWMFLIWWAGIAALPWILRSSAQHLLSLVALGLWMAWEINDQASQWFAKAEQYQLVLFSLLALAYYGLGLCLRGTRYHAFAQPTVLLGLVGFNACLFPLTWKVFYGGGGSGLGLRGWLAGLELLALGLVAVGVSRERGLTPQWRWTWGGALAGMAALIGALAWAHTGEAARAWQPWWQSSDGWYAPMTLAWFLLALLQVQVGIQVRSRESVNLGVGCAALAVLATYLNLFGSMARTGVMFVVSGLALVALGYYFERKRRSLLSRLDERSAQSPEVA